MLNFVQYHVLFHEKPLRAILEGVSVLSLAHQASSSSLQLNFFLYQFFLLANIFLIHDIKIPTQLPYSTNSNPFHGARINSFAPLVISLHLPLNTIDFFFMSSSHNGSGTRVFSSVGQFIKTLFLPSLCLITYIHLTDGSQKSNNWHLVITSNFQM